MSKIDICIIGPLPPPHGGVSVSVESYFLELKRSGVNVVHLRQHEIHRLILMRPRFVHLNLSRSYKRFLMTIFAKLIGAKVVHTIHGNEFNTRIWFNLLAAKLSHRLLCLNEVIFQRLRKQFGDKVFKVTPILACADDKNHQRISKRIEKDRKTLLLYAAGKVYIKGEEVYGVEFVVNMLPKLIDKGYELILLDPKNEYEDIASKSGLKYENHFRHITNYIDFNQLLNNVDIYLRPTSTDGQSVAVLEALSAGTKVIASDSVPRPRGVILYKFGSESSFLESLKTKVESESSPELTDVKGYLRILHGG